jgi:hypothetical protein
MFGRNSIAFLKDHSASENRPVWVNTFPRLPSAEKQYLRKFLNLFMLMADNEKHRTLTFHLIMKTITIKHDFYKSCNFLITFCKKLSNNISNVTVGPNKKQLLFFSIQPSKSCLHCHHESYN